MTTEEFLKSREVKSCPFCGYTPEKNDPETLHPMTKDGLIWAFNCVGNKGGCDASIIGTSQEECLEKWNTRCTDPRMEFLYKSLDQLEASIVKRIETARRLDI